MGQLFTIDLIQTSFSMFPGIGPNLEESIWAMGITNWDRMISFDPTEEHLWYKTALPAPELLREHALQWKEELKNKNFQFFVNQLPNRDLWKLWPIFPQKFCFLDIETTGIDAHSVMTVVSLYIDNQVYTFQRGKDLEFLLDTIKEDHLLVSYNGKRFDVPFMEREFHQKIPNVHLDLMNVLHEMGIKGGLKKSEVILGLKRGDDIAQIDGRLAPYLWKDYQENQNEKFFTWIYSDRS